MIGFWGEYNEMNFHENACQVAPNLLGMQLVSGSCRGIIVETEAYTADDPASHSFCGQTKRNASMFLPGGHVYLYRIYGVHKCFNVVTGGAGDGQAVLIRACEPLDGIPVMWQRRFGNPLAAKEKLTSENRQFRTLSSGPGNLTAAFGLDVSAQDGLLLALEPDHLKETEIAILPGRSIMPDDIVCTTRIGIGKDRGADMLRRWYVKDCRFVSKGQ